MSGCKERRLATVAREAETEVINLEAWVATYVRVIARLESVQVPPAGRSGDRLMNTLGYLRVLS
jgi:hypothetical protein